MSSLTFFSLFLCPCRCVWRSLCIGMEYSADSKLDDRERSQAAHAHTLITGVQWLLLQTSAGFHPLYAFTSYFIKLDSLFLDFWTPFVSHLTPPPPPFSLFSPSLHYSLSPPLFFPRWRLDRIWISLWAKMSWLSRLNPRGPGTRTGRHAVPSSPCTADPETCLMVFENHWRQVRHRIGLFALMLFVQIISLVQLQTFKLNLEHWL